MFIWTHWSHHFGAIPVFFSTMLTYVYFNCKLLIFTCKDIYSWLSQLYRSIIQTNLILYSHWKKVVGIWQSMTSSSSTTTTTTTSWKIINMFHIQWNFHLKSNKRSHHLLSLQHLVYRSLGVWILMMYFCHCWALIPQHLSHPS